MEFFQTFNDSFSSFAKALAEKVDIHPTYVGKLESGKNNVSIKLLFKIARALNTRLSKIFEFDK